MIEIKNLTFGYGLTPVLNKINLQAEPAFNAIIGPNAAGKSTLLKCIVGILQPEGEILFNGKELRAFKKEELMEVVGYLPQEAPTRSVLTVFEAILLGRLPTLSWRVTDQDLAVVLNVLESLRIDGLASRPLNELSGGQKQIVSIAQTLVRGPEFILMDEPANNLDLQRQLEIFDLIRFLTAKRKITFMIVLHDLNLAARYADNIIILNGQGGIYGAGKPGAVITAEMLSAVYGVKARVTIDGDGIPMVAPLGSLKEAFCKARISS